MDPSLEVRRFWFGKAAFTGDNLEYRQRLWFGVGISEEQRHTVDGLIRTRFGAWVERAAAGELGTWAGSPRRALSLILLLDQFPRHVYRGTARAFAADDAALALALSAMQAGADAALAPVERMFFYMPLQHAERLDAQDESLAAYRRLLGEAPAPQALFAGALQSAELHRSIVLRFGRFPHRNAVLGRASTAEETAYLAQGAQRFGQ